MIYVGKLAVVAGILATTVGRAAPPDTLVLTLDRCIKRALKQNFQVQQNTLQVKTARVNLQEAQNNLLPSLSGVSRYNYNVGRSVNPVTNDFTDLPVRSQDYGLSANLTLYDGWRNVRNIRQQKDAVRLSQYELNASQRQTVLTVLQTYLTVLSRWALWQDAQRRLNETEAELDRIRELVTAGELSPVQLTQLKAQRADDRLTVVRTRNDWQLARGQLRRLLFVPPDRAIRIRAPRLDQSGAPLPDLTEVYQQASAVSPALRGVTTQQLMSDRAVKMARSAHLPTVQLTLGGYSSYSDRPPPFQESYSYVDQLDFNLRKFVGVEMTLPIYNRGRIRAEVQRATIGQQQADLEFQQARQQLREAVETAYYNAMAARDEYRATQERELAMQEAMRSATHQFEIGVIDAITYSQARSQLSEATAARIRTKYQAMFYQKILDFYQNPVAQ